MPLIIGRIGDHFGLRTGVAFLYLTFGCVLSVGFWAKPLITNATVNLKAAPRTYNLILELGGLVRNSHLCLSVIFALAMLPRAWSQTSVPAAGSGIPYLQLATPRHVMPDAQPWEAKEFPHTMTVLQLNRGGYRYWGWYGLNEGAGLVWLAATIWSPGQSTRRIRCGLNARWPTVLAEGRSKDPSYLYFAITRDYDTPSSHIVLATSQRRNPPQRGENARSWRYPISAIRTQTYFVIPAPGVLPHLLSR